MFDPAASQSRLDVSSPRTDLLFDDPLLRPPVAWDLDRLDAAPVMLGGSDLVSGRSGRRSGFSSGLVPGRSSWQEDDDDDEATIGYEDYDDEEDDIGSYDDFDASYDDEEGDDSDDDDVDVDRRAADDDEE